MTSAISKCPPIALWRRMSVTDEIHKRYIFPITRKLGIKNWNVMDRQDKPADAFNTIAGQVTLDSQKGSHMRDYIAQAYFG